MPACNGGGIILSFFYNLRLHATRSACRFTSTPQNTEAPGPDKTRRSLTAQDPRHRLPRVLAGKCEQQIVDATPALELAVLTRCEYAKPRKPAGKNTEHEMCDLARDMNRAMRVVEKTDFLDGLGNRVIRKINRG